MANKLKDVADAAGVSPATASLVLNGRTEGRVSEAVAERVRQQAEFLNYRPNLVGRSLRKQSSKMIGLVSDQIATTPFASQLLAGAQSVAWKEKWLLFVANTEGDKEIEKASSQALLQHNVNGFLYASMYHREVEVPEEIQDAELVLLDCFDKSNKYHSVIPDEYQGARAAVEYLISKGHQKIAHITHEQNRFASPLREKAYRDVLAENNIDFNPEYLVKVNDANTKHGFEGAVKLLKLKNRPTAIFAYTDRMAMGVYEAIQDAGLEVGRDISVVGFDNQADIADALRPGLTTIQLPHFEMGAIATQLLIGQLDKNSESESGKVHLIECPFVERDSVGTPRT